MGATIPLELPGPAAAVQYVPPFTSPLQAMRRAGLVDVRFDKLSAKTHFEIAGVGLREVLLVARKPGHRPRVANHVAIYLGPLAQLTDDFGNTFPRGGRVLLNVHDWQNLKNGTTASQFLFLPPDWRA